jgi:hypothetical protein
MDERRDVFTVFLNVERCGSLLMRTDKRVTTRCNYCACAGRDGARGGG